MHYTKTLLLCQNGYRFGLPTGEGVPQGFEGLGSSIEGGWGSLPQWVWATPKVSIRLAEFPYRGTLFTIVKYSVLYFTWKFTEKTVEKYIYFIWF